MKVRVNDAFLTALPLFAGVAEGDLEQVHAAMPLRRYAPSEVICTGGDPGDSMFVIVSGVVEVAVAHPDSGRRTVAKLRRGDVVGEMSLLTGEPRSATVTAAVPTSVRELRREDFVRVVASQPTILANVARILSRRLTATTRRLAGARRGEVVALLVDEHTRHLTSDIVAAAAAASPRPVFSGPPDLPLAEGLSEVEGWIDAGGSVVIAVDLVTAHAPQVLAQADRATALVRGFDAAAQAGAMTSRAGIPADGVIVRESAEAAIRAPARGELAIVRTVTCARNDGRLCPRAADIAWLGRHLSRTKLGVALGAGGAKGYAHIGVLRALHQAGYEVDAVSGSSIGAVIGAWLALGEGTAAIETWMRRTFRPDVVEAMFQLSMLGTSTGLATFVDALRESVDGRSFADLVLPLVVMTVDLNSGLPMPLMDGPLLDALVAATALAGLFPPQEREDQRLIDALALVPVPARSLRTAGADVVVAVNVLNRETLPAWPRPVPATRRRTGSRSRVLDTLLEVMDLAQMEAGVREAAVADVAISPRFGPSIWRDFHLGDLFLEAGLGAAEEALPQLAALARPNAP
jgi:NTE family protein